MDLRENGLDKKKEEGQPQEPFQISSNYLFLALILVIVFAAVIGSILKFTGLSFKKNKFYAVFLANNQAYFGYLDSLKNDYVNLTDVYYLQLKEPLQEQRSKVQKEPEMTLIKLGSELHSPKDLMVVNKKQVLFIEELKDDSKVVKAIKDYEAEK